jgi:hypothetical protein
MIAITAGSEVTDFFETVEVDLMIELVHDSYRRWERGRRFLL